MRDKAESNGQLVAINGCRVQFEEIVCEPEIRRINSKTFGNCYLQRTSRKWGNPLRQLQHEVPRSTTLLVTAGEHVEQPGKFLGNRYLRHVDRKGIVGSSLGILAVKDVIALVRVVRRIVHAPVPSENSASIFAVRSVEIEASLIFVVHVDLNFCRCVQGLVNRACLSANCCLIFCHAICNRSLVGASVFRVNRVGEILQLARENRTDSERPQSPIRCRGEGKVVDCSCFGIAIDKLSFGRIYRRAIDRPNGLKGLLEVSKVHIIFVNLHRVVVI